MLVEQDLVLPPQVPRLHGGPPGAVRSELLGGLVELLHEAVALCRGGREPFGRLQPAEALHAVLFKA